MPEDTERQEQLLEELEEIVSQLAQQTDSKTTNLRVFMEEQDKKADAREKKRWAWFLTIVTSILLGLLVLGFETWERQYDRVNEMQKALIKIEQRQGFIQDQMLKKYEFKERLADLHRLRDQDREKALDRIVEELKEEIDKLQPRKTDGHTNRRK